MDEVEDVVGEEKLVLEDVEQRPEYHLMQRLLLRLLLRTKHLLLGRTRRLWTTLQLQTSKQRTSMVLNTTKPPLLHQFGEKRRRLLNLLPLQSRKHHQQM